MKIHWVWHDGKWRLGERKTEDVWLLYSLHEYLQYPESTLVIGPVANVDLTPPMVKPEWIGKEGDYASTSFGQ